jgi:adenine-specific DNA-methyltransferase
MIKYLGSKRLLLPRILDVVGALDGVRSVVDLFSGTSRVGHALKGAGYRVTSNDHNAYAHALGRCYVQADADRVLAQVTPLIDEMTAAPPVRGWFTETFCEEARFLHPDNGRRVEGMRIWLAEREATLDPDVFAVLLVSLMEGADRVDSTTGVQMAFLKAWAKRALKPLALRIPAVLPGAGRATCLDALVAARELEADLVYLDPPYNQHSYLGNYHMWESLVLWDSPEAYGIARKRIDCRTRKSLFNSRPKIRGALADVVAAVRAPWLLVSFSDEGFIDRADMESLLAERGPVAVLEKEHPRYVGARIGIYNPQGKKVGKVSHTRNTERLYVVAPSEDALERVKPGLQALGR